MKRKAIPHDPFHDPAPQISNVYEYDTPPDLPGFDSHKGSVGRVERQTDEHHRNFFKHESEHTKEYDFDRKGKK